MRPIDADALIEFCAERWIPLNIDAVNMQPTIQPEKTQLSQEDTTSDMISRQATLDAIEKMNIPEDMCVFEILSHIEVEIATLPPAQPEPTYEQVEEYCKKRCLHVVTADFFESTKPQRLGHWIKHIDPFDGEQYECSECGVLWEFNDGTPEDNEAYFCPNCGAKMTISTK